MELDQVFSHIKSKYPWILRNYWTPVVKSQDPSNKYISKLGGSNPFRCSNFQWPKCEKVHGNDKKVCGLQKNFYCQINIGDLPDEMKNYIGMDSGLLQIFQGRLDTYCDGDLDLKLFPQKEMIPSLKTLAAINIFKKHVNTDKLPDNLIKFVEDTNEEFIFETYGIGDLIGSQEGVQIQMWRKSEVKEIPSSHELKGMAIDDKLLQSLPRYDYEEIDTRLPVSIPDYRLPWLGPTSLVKVKLFGYIQDMGSKGREHYPQCLDCGLAKNITFLKMSVPPFDFSITLCPGCGKPGCVQD